jgi:hypothetical protein
LLLLITLNGWDSRSTFRQPFYRGTAVLNCAAASLTSQSEKQSMATLPPSVAVVDHPKRLGQPFYI